MVWHPLCYDMQYNGKYENTKIEVLLVVEEEYVEVK